MKAAVARFLVLASTSPSCLAVVAVMHDASYDIIIS